LKFAREVSFLILIAESDASNVVMTLNAHQQSPSYICWLYYSKLY